jgi:hypothetical protein
MYSLLPHPLKYPAVLYLHNILYSRCTAIMLSLSRPTMLVGIY